ncbi:hypothetical protein ADUPG1_014062, partial [Aduncisulcus paluster]
SLGRTNAVSGDTTSAPCSDPQNYVQRPAQRWLDGCKTDDGTVKQFTAVQKGSSASVESQLKREDFGGLSIRVFFPLMFKPSEVTFTIGDKTFTEKDLFKPLHELGLSIGSTINLSMKPTVIRTINSFKELERTTVGELPIGRDILRLEAQFTRHKEFKQKSRMIEQDLLMGEGGIMRGNLEDMIARASLIETQSCRRFASGLKPERKSLFGRMFATKKRSISSKKKSKKDSQVKLGKEMSLGAGAAITQKVYKSSRSLSDYDIYFPLVARVRICDEILWAAVTSLLPPRIPSPSYYPAKYRSLPFFSVKDSRLKDVKASNVLAMIQSLEQMTGDRPAEVDVGSIHSIPIHGQKDIEKEKPISPPSPQPSEDPSTPSGISKEDAVKCAEIQSEISSMEFEKKKFELTCLKMKKQMQESDIDLSMDIMEIEVKIAEVDMKISQRKKDLALLMVK